MRARAWRVCVSVRACVMCVCVRVCVSCASARVVRVIVDGILSRLGVAAQLTTERFRRICHILVVKRNGIMDVVGDHALGRGEGEGLVVIVQHKIHVKARQKGRGGVPLHDRLAENRVFRPFGGVY